MLKTAEYVTPKHPDKMCDIISDSILDFCLTHDPYSRVAAETMGGHGKVHITGEITTNAPLTDEVIKGIVKEVSGVEDVTTNIVQQSNFISQGVNIGGAGDQGIMVGFATKETNEYIPREYFLARSLCKFIYERFQVDGKTQVTINDDRIDSIIASFQNVNKYTLEEVVKEWLESTTIYEIPKIYCNMAGDWTQGGFDADTGLTGRKIAVDNYGPQIPIGGGAFSGKDATKVDRSGAYMARKIAVELLEEGNVHDVMVKIAYCIGKAEPTMVTATINGNEEVDITEKYMERCKPQNIINELGLRDPKFAETARWGHFGRGHIWDRVI